MSSVHHKPIKKFYLEGIIADDSMVGRLKQEYIRILTVEMRLAGYIQRLDIDPDFTIGYNEQRNVFEFQLTVYGVYVGRKKSECLAGIDGTRLISIQTNKSSESLLQRE